MPTIQSSPQEDSPDDNNFPKKLKITPPTNENTATTHNQEDGIQKMNTNIQTNNQTMDVEQSHRTNTNDLRQWLRQNKPQPTNANNNSNNDNAMEIDQAQTPHSTIEDDDTIQAGTIGEERNKSRCTIKLSFTAGESAITSCLLALTEFFRQFQRLGDRKAILLPWEEANLDDLDPITQSSSVPATVAGISGYIPKFFIRRGAGRRTEYLQLHIGHVNDINDIKRDMYGWMQEQGNDIYRNMLQAERYREIGFFTNSHITMDLPRLQGVIEEKIYPIKVGLRYKAVFRGRQVEDNNTASKRVRAIHIDLDLQNFHNNFKTIMGVYGRSVSGFDDGTKMRLFAHPDLVKSDKAKGKLTKAYERQKVFLEAIMQDYSSSPLWLDTVPDGSDLPTLREMILTIKSVKFPHISLFHAVDRTWNRMRYRGEFTFLYMPHLADEAELMMKNLLTYLQHQHGDQIYNYFTTEARGDLEGDKWDAKTNQIVCSTDEYMEEDDQDDIGLEGAQSYIEEQKQKMEAAKLSTVTRPDPSAIEDKVVQMRKEAEEQITAMKNKAEAAYYKDDDSIATMEDESASIGNKSSSTTSNLTTTSRSRSRDVVNLASVQNPANIGNVNQMEAASVASSITMESLAQLQQQSSSRMDNMDSMLNQILGALKSGQVSSHPEDSSTETGSQRGGSGGEA